MTSQQTDHPDSNKTQTTSGPLYKEMDSGLFRLFYPLIFLITALFVKSIIGQVVLLIPLVALHAWLTPRSGRAKLIRRVALTLLFILLGTLPILLTSIEGGGQAILTLRRWGVTHETLRLFGLISLRCLNGFLAILLITSTTPIYSVMHRLRALGVPALFVELSELIYRYINVMTETASHILTAQRCRLGYTTWRSRAEHSGMLFAQTFILAHNDAEKVYQGLLSRGYSEEDIYSTPSGQSEPTTLNDSLLSVANASFGYEKDCPILHDITLEIKKGERIVLLGENGAGKSTLFALLSGIHKVQNGALSLRGEVLTDVNDLRHTVGFVFQNPSHQLFTPSVADEIAFGLKNLGLKGEALESEVDRIIRDFELHPLMKTPPHLLSEGQKKWVAIASIVAMSPEVIILDEPTAGLDKYFTERIRGLLTRLHKEGKTIILSTHDMDFAHRWAQRGIILHQGRIIADGDIDMIFTDTIALREANLQPPCYSKLRVGAASKEVESCPIFLPSQVHHALIVGGGQGAYRKALTLSHHGIPFDVISPEVCPEMQALIAAQGAHHITRTFIQGDTWRYTLVVAGTGHTTVDNMVSEECHQRSILVNNLSSATESTFVLGASSSKGDTTFAIQTKHRLPEVGQVLRDHYETYLDTHLDTERLHSLSRLRQDMISARRKGDNDRYNELKALYDNEKNELINRL